MTLSYCIVICLFYAYLDVFHFLVGGRMRQPIVGFEGDILHEAFKNTSTKLPIFVGYHRIVIAMRLEYGYFIPANLGRWKLLMKREPTGERQHTGERLVKGQGRVQRQGASLRESA